ncbi:hypothetical protein INR49_008676 [Caranx melampygus]|nr:hypothetical protein INR49_008676 [Caranx melampygus]
MGGRLLCMKQYSQALSSCRVPGLKTDSLVFHAKTPNAPKHISVVHNGQIYIQLERICKASPHTTTEPVGILTTQYRDIWSRAYTCLSQGELLQKNPYLMLHFLTIQARIAVSYERSIFTVCLDNAKPRRSDEMRQSAILQMLHGGGSQCNSGNRWFDKGLQIIVGEDGTCGANGLHSAADGTVCMGLGDLTVTFMMKPKTTRPPEEPLPMPQKLHFNITPEIKKDIEEAKQHIDKMVRDLTLRITTFKHFGKNALKALKLSPDAFVQMAIQLAYYRMHRQCCPTFEPASLRMFKLGRVAAIHSNSKASADFVKAFDDPSIKNSEKVDLLKKAIKTHKWYTNMVVSGQGIEGHLLGLRLQTAEENIPMPELFTDTSFTKAFDYQISTSQVISKTNCLPCVGPETPDMYDVCYSILSDHISLIVSRFEPPNTCKETCAERMIEVMVDALLDMRRMLEHQEAF